MSHTAGRVLPRHKKEQNWAMLVLVLLVIYQRFIIIQGDMYNLHCKTIESVL